MPDLTIDRERSLGTPPDPNAVRTLYASPFADRYDTSADRWERLTCRPALTSFQQLLSTLPKRPLDVLDIGCGTGRNLRRLVAASVEIDRYRGVDNSERMLEHAAHNHPYSRAEFVEGDAIDALRETSPPDVILLTWVLSHQADPTALLDAATTALAPGGRILVLALTATDSLLGRAHAWRFRRFLHATPIHKSVLDRTSPSLLATSCSGLITVADIPRRTLDEKLARDVDQQITAHQSAAQENDRAKFIQAALCRHIASGAPAQIARHPDAFPAAGS